MVLKDTQQILDILNSTPGPKLYELPPPEARALYLEMGRQLDLPPETLHSISDVSIPASHGTLPARLYQPEAECTGPLVVYFHGGGWVIGDLESHHSFCTALARQLGLRVLAVDYRLAPEYPFPAAHDDCLAAARWASSSPAELGAAVPAIALAGDSAGGNLAIATGLAMSDGARPLAQLLLYPATDLVEQSASYKSCGEGYLLDRPLMEWFCDSYAPGKESRTDSRLSPLRLDDVSASPPTVLFTCGLDPLRDEGRAYAAKLVNAGIEVHFSEAKGQIHGVATLRGGIASAAAPLNTCIGLFGCLVRRSAQSGTDI